MQDSNTKVVITTPVLLVGGTEMHILNLLRGLMSDGYDVSVCCYYESDPSMVSQIEATSAKVILMDSRRSGGVFDLFVRLKRLFREMKPDIVHVQYIAPGLLPIIAAKVAGVRTVFATVHQPGRIYGWKPKLLIRVAAYLADAFICTSKSVEKSWFGHSEVFDPINATPSRKHFTIYNGVDIDRLQGIVKHTDQKRLRESLNINDKKVIGVVGRLRSEKGHIVLLNAMPGVLKAFPETLLLVIGDGPDRENLKFQADRLGISRYVLWFGQKEHDEVLQLYSIMDVVVLPSLFEGFGLTAAEAMAASRPVVASNVDGLAEVIQGGVNGLLVPPRDNHAMVKAILELLSNPAKGASMGVCGREMVEKQFSMVRYHSNTLAAYSFYIENLNRA